MPRLDAIDYAIARWMARYGHLLHRISLGLVFAWFGSLKVAGYPTATGLIAHTVYLFPARIAVPILGAWEVAIGICLILRPLVRVALLLLLIRLPGTLLALIIHADICFGSRWWVPTPEGQYLIKDLALFSAALVIGGTVRRRGPSEFKH